ncbi:MAG: putative molybdenum carrier protein [Pirellulaceae bacterium]
MPQQRAQHLVERIVSGGQTGVDQAALDVAIALGIPHGGWCPRGRRSEAGRIPDRYQLQECDSENYRIRTEQNVIDSDGTLILFRKKLTGGTKFTYKLAVQHQKPHLLVDLDFPPSLDDVVQWIHDQQLRTLNVAGPRESTSPGIAQQAASFLTQMFDE